MPETALDSSISTWDAFGPLPVASSEISDKKTTSRSEQYKAVSRAAPNAIALAEIRTFLGIRHCLPATNQPRTQVESLIPDYLMLAEIGRAGTSVEFEGCTEIRANRSAHGFRHTV